MKNLKQRGTTLFELLTYLILLSMLLASLATTEKVARKSVQQQILMLRLNEDSAKINQFFRNDVLAALRSENQHPQDNLLVLVHPHQKVNYQINEKGELWRHVIPETQITPTESLLISSRIFSHSFQIDPSGLINFQFRLRSAFTNKNLGEIFGAFHLKALPRLSPLKN